MENLAGVVQQLRKERDQAARTVEQLDAALAALTGLPRQGKYSQSFVVGSTRADRGCAASTLGKGTRDWQAEAQRCHYAQEEDDVGCRAQENCRGATRAVG